MNLGLALAMGAVPTRVKQGGSPGWVDPLASLSGVGFRAETYRSDGALQDYWLDPDGNPIVDDGVSTFWACGGSANPLVGSHWDRVYPERGTLFFSPLYRESAGLNVAGRSGQQAAWVSTASVEVTAFSAILRFVGGSAAAAKTCLVGFGDATLETWGAHLQMAHHTTAEYKVAFKYGSDVIYERTVSSEDEMLAVYSMTVNPITGEVKAYVDGVQVGLMVVSPSVAFSGYLGAKFPSAPNASGRVAALMAYDHADRVAVEGYYAELLELATV